MKNFKRFYEDGGDAGGAGMGASGGDAGSGDAGSGIVSAQPGELPGTTGSEGSGDRSAYLVPKNSVKKLKPKKGKRVKSDLSHLTTKNNVMKIRDFQFNGFLVEMLNEPMNEGDNNNVFTWDFPKDVQKKNSLFTRMKSFLGKLSKDMIEKYFIKFIEEIKSLTTVKRRKMIAVYSSIFVSLLSLSYLEELTKRHPDTEVKFVVNEVIDMNTESSFEIAQKFVSFVEQGYSDDRKDRGNYVDGKFVGTKYGVSAPVLKKYLGKTPTMDDMKNLSYDTALAIFQKNYWEKNNLDKITNQSLATLIYDGAINQGNWAMRKSIIKILNDYGVHITEDDNPFSEEMMYVLNTLDQEILFKEIKGARERLYKNSRTFNAHGKGWLNRLNSLKFEQ